MALPPGLFAFLRVRGVGQPFKLGDPVWIPDQPRIDGFVQDRPWKNGLKHVEPLLSIERLDVVLVTRFDEREEESRIDQYTLHYSSSSSAGSLAEP